MISANAQELAAGFTQFWALPTANNIFEIGIANDERWQAAHNIVVTDARNNILDQWPAEVAAGMQWTLLYQVPPASANGQALNILLYRQSSPTTIYRQVRYWTLSPADLIAMNATATATALSATATANALSTPFATPRPFIAPATPTASQ